MRKNQLVLIERSDATARADFHLDERTREMGRLGVAAAREALRSVAAEALSQPSQQSQQAA